MTDDLRILHVSDIHFGPPHVPEASEALLELVRAEEPAAVVISGDLVQRSSFSSQWAAAEAFLAAIDRPTLVVPGNHDLPLYNYPLRWWNPLGAFRRHVGREPETVLEMDGGVLVGLDTTSRLRVIHGRVGRRQLAELRERLAPYRDDERLKVVVGHHPLVWVEGSPGRLLIWGASRLIDLLQTEDVDLYLSGHCHCQGVARVGTGVEGGPGLLAIQAGTASSTRGRGAAKDLMTINWVEATDGEIRVRHDEFDPGAGRFVPLDRSVHVRRPDRGRTVPPLPGGEDDASP